MRGRRSFRSAGSLAAIAALLGLFAAGAQASIVHEPEPFSPLTGSGSGLTITEPQAVAVDEVSGNLFLTDTTGNEAGEGAVLILGGEGGAPAGLVSPFAIGGFTFHKNETQGVAYDNSATSPSKGTLYVYNETIEKITKFTRNVASERYEAAGEFPATSTGAGDGVGLNLDTAGNVYLGSFDAEAIYKFSPAGTLLHKWVSPAELPAALNRPGQIAVDDAGDLFIQRGGGSAYKCPVGAGETISPASCLQITPQNPLSSSVQGLALDRSHNDLYVVVTERGLTTASYIVEYNASTLAKIGEFGKEGRLGEEGILGAPQRIAVNEATGRIYVPDSGSNAGGHHNVVVFGPPVIVPTAKATAASNVLGTKATLNGSVNPEGVAIVECKFEYGATASYGKTAPCEGAVPTDSEPHPVSLSIGGLESNGHTYHYRLFARNSNGVEKSADKTLVTANTVATEPATSVTKTTATLNGAVRPEGLEYSACRFEWGLTTTAGYEHTNQSCVPSAAELEPDFGLHAVSAPLTGLKANSTYKFRLTATNPGGTLSGIERTFTTTGPPQIGEIAALNATQSTATIEARINPSGFETAYRFEWGPTSSYGHAVPVEYEPNLGSGTTAKRATANLSALAPATRYHYRVVATSSAGTTVSPDQQMETLNSCGLPDGRCLEMVSSRDPFAAAQPGSFFAGVEIHYQAAEEPGSLAYVVEVGEEDATKSAEILYQGTRGGAGWSSSQLSPPITAPDRQTGTNAGPSEYYGLSADLSCGAVGATQLLTSDPVAKLIVEAGGANLYRRNPDGTYTLVTDIAPEVLAKAGANLAFEYELIGMSADCSKVVFSTRYHYPGIPGAGNERLYEWDDAHGIRNVGWVPSGSGAVPVEAVGGSPNAGANGDRFNAVSDDGSRVFFSAKRVIAGNPADPGEIGKTGLFAREGGTLTRDVSASQTTTPDNGASFQGATPGGSRVYFTANAGLTAESSSEGTDLYEYDFGKPEGERLSDLSVSHEAGGAEAGGAIGASLGALVALAPDGSHAYFVARGQLAPGRGATYGQNKTAGTFSLYDYEATSSTVSFVGTVRGGELAHVTLGKQRESTSRVSPDGRYLLFESRAQVTGYESGGVPEVYLYDAQAAAEATVCISCRHDGQPSTNSSELHPLAFGASTNALYQPQSLTVHNGEPQGYFLSEDQLAQGAAEGRPNLYEWVHGQVFLITSQPRQSIPLQFAGAGSDGGDLYFYNSGALNWENPEARPAAWDARIGGGFAEPPPPPSPCDPGSEGSCQGSSVQPPGTPPAASSTFKGSGNVRSTPEKKKKKHKKKSKHHKKSQKQKRRAGK